jgi:hypothetical protein
LDVGPRPQDSAHKSAQTAYWVKAGSVYPGDHTQGGSLTMQQYKSMYDDFGSEDKAVKHLIEVMTHVITKMP